MTHASTMNPKINLREKNLQNIFFKNADSFNNLEADNSKITAELRILVAIYVGINNTDHQELPLKVA